MRCYPVSGPDWSLSFLVAQAEQEAVTYGIYIVSERKKKKTKKPGAWRKVRYPQDWGLRQAWPWVYKGKAVSFGIPVKNTIEIQRFLWKASFPWAIFFNGKKWIYSEGSTPHIQSVGHLRRRERPSTGFKGAYQWNLSTSSFPADVCHGFIDV